MFYIVIISVQEISLRVNSFMMRRGSHLTTRRNAVAFSLEQQTSQATETHPHVVPSTPSIGYTNERCDSVPLHVRIYSHALYAAPCILLHPSLLLSYSQPVLPPIVNSFLLLILSFILSPCHYVFSLDMLFQLLLHCFHFSFIPFPSLRSSMSPITHWFLQTSFRSSSHLTIPRHTHPSFRPFVNITARTSKQTLTNSHIHPYIPPIYP